jgi:hypothetical protein
MANSYFIYTADGDTQLFTAPAYIDQDHISCEVDGEDESFTWNSSSVIDLGYKPTAGATVKVFRTTPRDTRLVDFTTTSMMDEENLDKDSNQLFYIMQEVLDNNEDAITLSTSGEWDFNSKQSENVPDPTTDDSVANKAYVDAKTAGDLNFDDRYYTETELDGGQLDTRYYTETELDGGQLDSRYYTQTELDGGQLDTRYYTKDAADAAFMASDGNVVKKNEANEYSKTQNFDEAELSISDGNVPWDLAEAQVANLTIDEDVTIDAPTNRKQGAAYVLKISQDAVGGHTVSWDALFKWEGDDAPVMPTAANALMICTFMCNGTYLYGQVFWMTR